MEVLTGEKATVRDTTITTVSRSADNKKKNFEELRTHLEHLRL